MIITRRTVAAVTLLAFSAFVPAGAASVRSEMSTYIGSYEAVGQVCGGYGTYDLGYVSMETHFDHGSACFDLRGETRVDVSLRDIAGTNVSGYYEFMGCDNCGCYWCPVSTHDCPLCFTDTGTWDFFCNVVSRGVPAGATELKIILLVNGPCASAVPPTVGSVTVAFFD